MIVFAVRTDDKNDTLIVQFEDKVDARGFVHFYSCNTVPMYVTEQSEDSNYGIFTYLPGDSTCRDAIELYTGVRL